MSSRVETVEGGWGGGIVFEEDQGVSLEHFQGKSLGRVVDTLYCLDSGRAFALLVPDTCRVISPRVDQRCNQL